MGYSGLIQDIRRPLRDVERIRWGSGRWVEGFGDLPASRCVL